MAGRILAGAARRASRTRPAPRPRSGSSSPCPPPSSSPPARTPSGPPTSPGIQLQEQSLLDEPNAAFLDYVLTCRPRTDEGWHFDLTYPRNVLVFDFGGGTCDVSILRVHADGDEQRLQLSNLSIARYEQLGGDNIDAAIVEHVLLPQLLEQNGLESLDLTFTEKKERIVPQLLSTAEALKLRVCGTARPRCRGSIQIDLPPRPKSPAADPHPATSPR